MTFTPEQEKLVQQLISQWASNAEIKAKLAESNTTKIAEQQGRFWNFSFWVTRGIASTGLLAWQLSRLAPWDQSADPTSFYNTYKKAYWEVFENDKIAKQAGYNPESWYATSGEFASLLLPAVWVEWAIARWAWAGLKVASKAKLLANLWLKAGKTGEAIKAWLTGTKLAQWTLWQWILRAGVSGAKSATAFSLAQKWEVTPWDIALWAGLWVVWAGIAGKAKQIIPTLRQWAEKQVLQALWPTKEKYKQMATKIAPTFLQKWIKGSRESIQEKAKSNIEIVGQQIDDLFAKWEVKGKTQISPILSKLDTMKEKVAGVDLDPQKTKIINDFKSMLSKFWDDLDPNKARAVRQSLDRMVYNTKGIIADEALSVKNSIRKNIADEIRNQFAKQNPNLATINKEFSFWSSLDDILTETAKRTWPQQGGLVSKIAASGALAWWFASGGAIPAIASAVFVKQFVSAMQSPLWKTVSAQSKNKLADAIARGDKNTIIKVVAEIQKKIPAIKFSTYIKNNLWLNE